MGMMQVAVDTWPKSADRMLEIAGLVLCASHVVFLALFVMWYGLRKPTTLKLFKARMKAALRGQPMPEEVPGPKYRTEIYRTAAGWELPPRGSMARKAMQSRQAARKNGDPGR